MKTINYTLVFVTIALFSGGQTLADGLAGKTSNPLSEFELGKHQYCGSDADCVKAVNGCCDCANGGQDVAVNKTHLAEFIARFDCIDTVCTERAKHPPCGSGVVSCVNHKCKYFESASESAG